MSRETDELFRHARDAGRPTPDDLLRTRRGLDAKLVALGVGSAAGVASKTAAATGSLAPKALGLSLAVKVVSVLGLVAATATGVVVTTRHVASTSAAPTVPPKLQPSHRSESEDARRTLQPTPIEAPPAPISEPAPSTLPSTVVVAPSSTPSAVVLERKRNDHKRASVTAEFTTPNAPVPMNERSGETGSVPSAAPSLAVTTADPAYHVAEPLTTNDRLGEEVAQLRRVDEALRAGDAATALGEIESAARSYPHGALSEEREAARVLALCALGRRDDARRAAVVFRATYPRSTSEARLRRSCVAETP